MKLISKDAVVAEIDNLLDKGKYHEEYDCAYRDGNNDALYALKEKIDTFEVKDPYEQCIQYPSIKDGIKAHAETYSFNIESQLFHQLTEEQQKLWRKEIEQAVISGGEIGVELTRDIRYKENVEVKEVNLEKEIGDFIKEKHLLDIAYIVPFIAKYFFELGLTQKGEEV